MTPTQREAALRLIDELSRPHCDLGQQEAAALLRELLAEPQGEPVAWKFSRRYGSGLSFIKPAPLEDDDAFAPPIPLYTHPPQQRRPLTEKQIVETANSCFSEFDDCAQNLTTAFARAIERAHGIVETP